MFQARKRKLKVGMEPTYMQTILHTEVVGIGVYRHTKSQYRSVQALVGLERYRAAAEALDDLVLQMPRDTEASHQIFRHKQLLLQAGFLSKISSGSQILFSPDHTSIVALSLALPPTLHLCFKILELKPTISPPGTLE